MGNICVATTIQFDCIAMTHLLQGTTAPEDLGQHLSNTVGHMSRHMPHETSGAGLHTVHCGTSVRLSLKRGGGVGGHCSATAGHLAINGNHC